MKNMQNITAFYFFDAIVQTNQYLLLQRWKFDGTETSALWLTDTPKLLKAEVKKWKEEIIKNNAVPKKAAQY